jgi:hypothetical protein
MGGREGRAALLLREDLAAWRMYAAPGTERVFDSVVVLGSAGRGGVCGEGRGWWVRMYVLWGGWGCASGHLVDACVESAQLVTVSEWFLDWGSGNRIRMVGRLVRARSRTRRNFSDKYGCGAKLLTGRQALDKTSLATAPDDVPV